MKTKRRQPLTVSRFLVLPDEEKEKVYQECEAIGPDHTRALTPAQRRRWEKAKRRVNRRSAGLSHTIISLKLENRLLARADALAEKLGTTRAVLVAEGLEAVLADADSDGKRR